MQPHRESAPPRSPRRARGPGRTDGRAALSFAAMMLFAGCTLRVPYDVPQLDAGPDASGPIFDTGPGPRDTGPPGLDAETGPPDVPFDDDATGDAIGDATDTREPPPPPPAELAGIEAQIFAVHCANCHVDRVSGGLSLRSGPQLYDALLAPSVQVPSLPRIAPGDPEGSYLWLKVSGGHLDAGGLGAPMPIGGTLPEPLLELLYRWIAEGAVETRDAEVGRR